MHRAAGWGGVLLLLCAGAGCGPSYQAYAEVMKENLDAIEDVTRILSTVKDQGGMVSAKEQLKQRLHATEELARKTRAMPKPSEEVRDRILEEMGRRIAAVTMKQQEELSRIEKLPGGKEFLTELGMLR